METEPLMVLNMKRDPTVTVEDVTTSWTLLSAVSVTRVEHVDDQANDNES